MEAPSMSPASLDDYFSEQAPRHSYSSHDLADIQQLLYTATTNEEKRWSPNPKLYTILRITGQLDRFERVSAEGITDDCLPLTTVVLSRLLVAEERSRFIEVQSTVMTRASTFVRRLETGSVVEQHAHFDTRNPLFFEDLDVLGEGSYATVHLIKTKNNMHYAVKRFSRRRNGKMILEGFLKEVQIMRRVKHHHCVQLMASYTNPDHYGLIMSPHAEFNLKEYYDEVLANTSQRPVLRTFFGCLAHALAYLHQTARIRHKDIKPANILVRQGKVYLADFGISHYWHGRGASTTADDVRRSLLYCAPEVADPSFKKRNTLADVWSLGCVFLEMFTILKGRSIDQLRLHLGTDLHFRNINAIGTWMDHLGRFHSAQEDDAIPTWIDRMLREDLDERMSSSLVCQQIFSADHMSGSCSPRYTCNSCLPMVDAKFASLGRYNMVVAASYITTASDNQRLDFALEPNSELFDDSGQRECKTSATVANIPEEGLRFSKGRGVEIERQRLWPSRSRLLEPFDSNSRGYRIIPPAHIEHQVQRGAYLGLPRSTEHLRQNMYVAQRVHGDHTLDNPSMGHVHHTNSRSDASVHQRSHALKSSSPSIDLGYSHHYNTRKLSSTTSVAKSSCEFQGAFHSPEKWTPIPELSYNVPQTSLSSIDDSCDEVTNSTHTSNVSSRKRYHLSNRQWEVHNEPSIASYRDHFTRSPLPYLDDFQCGKHDWNFYQHIAHQKTTPAPSVAPPGWIQVGGTWYETDQKARIGRRVAAFFGVRVRLPEDPRMPERTPKRQRGPWVKW